MFSPFSHAPLSHNHVWQLWWQCLQLQGGDWRSLQLSGRGNYSMNRRVCGSKRQKWTSVAFPLSVLKPTVMEAAVAMGNSQHTRLRQSQISGWRGELRKRASETWKTSRRPQKGGSLGKQDMKLFKNFLGSPKAAHVGIQFQMANQRLRTESR